MRSWRSQMTTMLTSKCTTSTYRTWPSLEAIKFTPDLWIATTISSLAVRTSRFRRFETLLRVLVVVLCQIFIEHSFYLGLLLLEVLGRCHRQYWLTWSLFLASFQYALVRIGTLEAAEWGLVLWGVEYNLLWLEGLFRIFSNDACLDSFSENVGSDGLDNFTDHAASTDHSSVSFPADVHFYHGLQLYEHAKPLQSAQVADRQTYLP
jgi:hypothetical protein